ncbi:MAG: hypothetical protein VKJ06_03085 [Vampirovibrionales bacterium]|nr:hypothetical protein [Vampirovibrionales bacterium]
MVGIKKAYTKPKLNQNYITTTMKRVKTLLNDHPELAPNTCWDFADEESTTLKKVKPYWDLVWQNPNSKVEYLYKLPKTANDTFEMAVSGTLADQRVKNMLPSWSTTNYVFDWNTNAISGKKISEYEDTLLKLIDTDPKHVFRLFKMLNRLSNATKKQAS